MNSRCTRKTIQIRGYGWDLEGDLTVPLDAQAVILFAHGSGSSRHSPRNKFVASELNKDGFATLLLDLLTHEEERNEQYTGEHRFNIALLSDRLTIAVDWLAAEPLTSSMAVGLFGASTGSAAALTCAASRPTQILAVVSRGGRPDLAGSALKCVACPTLLIVGSRDPQVLVLNRLALHDLKCYSSIALVGEASHLFEEPGALEEVAELASRWFGRFCSQATYTGLLPYETVQGLNSSALPRHSSGSGSYST